MKILITIGVCLLSFNLCYSQCWEWSTKLDSTMVFSSPRFVDLNGDKIQDVVIGAGNEFNKTSNGVVAINGQNGNILWKVSVPTQIYTSALFQDISGDKIPDILLEAETRQCMLLMVLQERSFGNIGRKDWQIQEKLESSISLQRNG